MKKILLLLVFGILLFGMIPYSVSAAKSSVVGITNIDRCMTLDKAGETYVLMKDVSSDGTCFEIKADNVVLDGQNKKIEYGKKEKGYGVYAENVAGPSVRNLIIEEGSYETDSKHAIYFFNSKKGKIDNNIIVTRSIYSYGIRLYSSSSDDISNNVITTSGGYGYGIVLSFNTKSNTFFRNTVTTSGIRACGILLYSGSNSNIFSDIFIKTLNENPYSNAFCLSDLDHSFIMKDSIIDSKNLVVSSFAVYSNVAGGTFNFTNVTRVDGKEILRKWEEGAGGTLNVYWYLDVAVKNKDGVGISNTDVSVYDKSGKLVYSGKTDDKGRIEKIVIREYSETRNGEKYDAPYTVKVVKDEYIDAERSVELKGNSAVEFVLARKERMFVRGDANSDEKVNIADAQFILSYIFAKGTVPTCLDSADVNDNGKIEIGDAVYLLSYLFSKGKEPPAPFGVAGVDPTIDELGC